MPRIKPTHAVLEIVVRPLRPGVPFPIDMMRYDNCAPHREVDSHRIERSREYNNDPETSAVWLDMYYLPTGQELPTFKRWESMGWTVERQGKDACDEYIRAKEKNHLFQR